MGEQSKPKGVGKIPEELFHGVWAVMHRYAEGAAHRGWAVADDRESGGA